MYFIQYDADSNAYVNIVKINISTVHRETQVYNFC